MDVDLAAEPVLIAVLDLLAEPWTLKLIEDLFLKKKKRKQDIS